MAGQASRKHPISYVSLLPRVHGPSLEFRSFLHRTAAAHCPDRPQISETRDDRERVASRRVSPNGLSLSVSPLNVPSLRPSGSRSLFVAFHGPTRNSTPISCSCLAQVSKLGRSRITLVTSDVINAQNVGFNGPMQLTSP